MPLPTKVPPRPIYRVGRKPDAWQPPDWPRAAPDGTFGNRFDDPESYYRVLYASSQEVSCFVETLACFRLGLTVLAELDAIEGGNDFSTPGAVPRAGLKLTCWETAVADGNYAEIFAGEWIVLLHRKLASDCLSLGVTGFDASVLQSGSPRRITQLASRVVFELSLPGIYYRSRYGHDFENWALFEPFRISDNTSWPVAKDNPAPVMAATILGLKPRFIHAHVTSLRAHISHFPALTMPSGK